MVVSIEERRFPPVFGMVVSIEERRFQPVFGMVVSIEVAILPGRYPHQSHRGHPLFGLMRYPHPQHWVQANPTVIGALVDLVVFRVVFVVFGVFVVVTILLLMVIC